LIAGAGANAACGGTTGAVPVRAGSHTVSEAGASGTVLSDYVTSIGAPCAANGSISLALGQNATCTITNTKKARVKVVKTVRNPATGTDNPPVSTQSFTFEIRQGASTTSTGTTLETGTANAGNGGIVSFAVRLTPGQTYQVCEIVMAGWMTTLGPPFYAVYSPSGDNSTVCTDVTAGAGATHTFSINNIPPPGGMTRTIGFWKNWSSCSGGSQAPKLDQTLALSDPAGTAIGTLILHGGDCVSAVRILNKSRVSDGKKMSSDAAFNMAAQLLAARLNVQAGAGVCPAAVTAINNGQALLVAIGFNGTSHANMTAAQTNQANALAVTLDQYNNDNTTLCAAP